MCAARISSGSDICVICRAVSFQAKLHTTGTAAKSRRAQQNDHQVLVRVGSMLVVGALDEDVTVLDVVGQWGKVRVPVMTRATIFSCFDRR